MADENTSVVLDRVNEPPAQTWNRLRANDITLTVPKISRKGDVYFALPQLFSRVECGMGEKVTNWVTSQAADARYVEVRAGEKREEPIVVAIDTDKGEVADTGVMVRAGATVSIVVARGRHGCRATTSASLLRVVAEEARTSRSPRSWALAPLSSTEVVGIGSSQQHLESVGVDADDDARVEVRQYALGGGTVAFGTAVSLSGDRARANIGLRYFADGKDRLDVNHVVRQRGKNTIAHVRENGILDDAAEKALRATIDLVHGARGSKGDEVENVLVFGDDVVNKTVPVILCDEDDVQGNHGATIGTVGPEQMDYLADRGLSRKDAEALFVRALFEDAIINAPEAHAHDVAVGQAERVLGAEVAHDFDASVQLAENEEA